MTTTHRIDCYATQKESEFTKYSIIQPRPRMTSFYEADWSKLSYIRSSGVGSMGWASAANNWTVFWHFSEGRLGRLLWSFWTHQRKYDERSFDRSTYWKKKVKLAVHTLAASKLHCTQHFHSWLILASQRRTFYTGGWALRIYFEETVYFVIPTMYTSVITFYHRKQILHTHVVSPFDRPIRA